MKKIKLKLFLIMLIVSASCFAGEVTRFYMMDARGWNVSNLCYICPDCNSYKVDIFFYDDRALVNWTYWPNGKQTFVSEVYIRDYSSNQYVTSEYTKKYKSTEPKTIRSGMFSHTVNKYLYLTSDYSKIVMQENGPAILNYLGEECEEDSPFVERSSGGNSGRYGNSGSSYNNPSYNNPYNSGSGATIDTPKYCRICGGDGKCKTCGGSGKRYDMTYGSTRTLDCPNCTSNKGKCSSCGGSGRR